MTAISHSPIHTVENTNYHHLVADIAWFGLAFSATQRFLSVYALRLGATEADLGWITSLPALLLAITATFALRWRAHRSSSVTAVLLPTFVFRLVFLLPALTPFIPRQWQVLWLVFSATMPSLGQGIASVLFLASIQESVSQRRLTDLFSRRSVFFNLSLAVSALIFGWWLRTAPFPMNYQLMYVAAFAFAMLSLWHVAQLQPIFSKQTPQDNRAAASSPWQSRQFRELVVVMLVVFVAYFATFALVNARLVKEMRADEAYMAIYGLVELGAGALASSFAPLIVNRFGYRVTIGIAMMLTASAPLLLALTSSLAIALIAAALTGGAWAFVAMVGISGLYTQVTPVENSTRYGVAFHQAYGIAVFAAPFIGTLLIQSHSTLTQALLIGALLRVTAGVIIGFPRLTYGIARYQLPHN
jgi:predicted MFS family arabinose efflux permease